MDHSELRSSLLSKFTTTDGKEVQYYSLPRLGALGYDISKLPFSVRIVLESLARNLDGKEVKMEDVERLVQWNAKNPGDTDIPFKVSRVLMQDFTGVPAVVDMAAIRQYAADNGKSAESIQPLIPVDLIIDHSVQVDSFNNAHALEVNQEKEMERNRERYALLKWASESFEKFRIFPPSAGICHQINLEYLATCVTISEDNIAYPDTLVGTDSHTTMINGLGIVGFGVGGIEAEAALLGQAVALTTPKVLGVRLTGKLSEGVTATDFALTLTKTLREKGVVNMFVEFFGDGLKNLTLPERATLSNMCPEYGATIAIFPVDEETLRYMEITGRRKQQVDLVRQYYSAQNMLGMDYSKVEYSDVIDVDLSNIVPCVSGPSQPKQEIPLERVKDNFMDTFMKSNGKDLKAEERISSKDYSRWASESMSADNGSIKKTLVHKGIKSVRLKYDDGYETDLSDGDVVISSITSCTNTSNPSVMIGAGILAKKALEHGLHVNTRKVKTSLGPGSRVVMRYMEKAGLVEPLARLGYGLVGYGCITCISKGTPILLKNGTTRKIESLPQNGGARLFGPTTKGMLGTARQSTLIERGLRDCVRLILQDGRSLVCTPDHMILCQDNRWIRADELAVGKDRIITGLEGPLDEQCSNEKHYTLQAGELILKMDTQIERDRMLAFARLLGYLLGDGSISAGQSRISAGQAVDREMMLDDIELLTGKRPAANRYDERRWSVVLPRKLTKAFVSLPGILTGRRIRQVSSLPEFVLKMNCPKSVVREFLGGMFGADGHAPLLHRFGRRNEDMVLEHPAYSFSASPEHLERSMEMIHEVVRLLSSCGVKTEGARIYTYKTRQSKSSYALSRNGITRIEVRLHLPDGLSFVECLGFRYCVNKMLRASAAAVYWRTVKGINEQRLQMAEQIAELHSREPKLSFSQARQNIAMATLNSVKGNAQLQVVSPHYALLEGYDRFSRLPKQGGRKFRPLHRKKYGFLSPVGLFEQLSVLEWFTTPTGSEGVTSSPGYCIDKESTVLPTLPLLVVDRHQVGQREVFDLSVDGLHTFIAGTVGVHNCIGNSGPLIDKQSDAINSNGIAVASVLSGNRNYEARIHRDVRANYLMSPMLLIAYGIAGTVLKDLTSEPLAKNDRGEEVYLKDIWPTSNEIYEAVKKTVSTDLFEREYGSGISGVNPYWNSLDIPKGVEYAWNDKSTYIKLPPFFEGFNPKSPRRITGIYNARILAVFGDSVSTDHISPAGAIGKDSPAGRYLIEHGVNPQDFNTYGSRRGNHEVMMRGTFANNRIKNKIMNGKEGGYTMHFPDMKEMSIYETAMAYRKEGIPLVVLAGNEYGSGSSRDWAAKGPALLGVRAVVAKGFERIHRSNLIGMGVMPLQFSDGEDADSLEIDYTKPISISISEGMKPRDMIKMRYMKPDGAEHEARLVSRIDTDVEMEYYRAGGILNYVISNIFG